MMGHWPCLKDHAPSDAPALALYPSSAARRPIRTQLGTPNRRASGPLFLQPCIRPSRGPHRSLPVVPLIADKRYYGEAPVRLRRYERAVGDAVPPCTQSPSRCVRVYSPITTALVSVYISRASWPISRPQPDCL